MGVSLRTALVVVGLASAGAWAAAAPPSGGMAAGRADANGVVEGQLDRELTELTANDVALERAWSYLQVTCNVEIDVNWKALEAAGISQKKRVTLAIKHVAVRDGIRQVLRIAGGSTALAYEVKGGKVVVSTADDLSTAEHFVTGAYDVRDLAAAGETFDEAWLKKRLEEGGWSEGEQHAESRPEPSIKMDGGVMSVTAPGFVQEYVRAELLRLHASAATAPAGH